MPSTTTTKTRPAATKQVTPRPKANTNGTRPGKSAPPAAPPAPRATKAPASAKVAADASQPVLSDERVERTQLARSEHKALQAWQKSGEKGERPATPNLDALNNGKKVTATKPAGEARVKNPRRATANECMKEMGGTSAGRGELVKLTDAELVAYCKKVQKENPTSSMSDELEVAYWCERMVVSRPRWNKAWADANGTAAEATAA